MSLFRQYRYYLALFLVLAFWAATAAIVVRHDAWTADQALTAVNQSRLIVDKGQRLALLVERMMASRRGYMLSGDLELAARYEDSKALSSGLIADLSTLMKDDAAQTSRLSELQHHFLNLTEKLEEIEQVAPPDKGIIWNPNPAGEKALGPIHDDLMRVNQDIQAQAQALLAARTQTLEKTRREGTAVLVAADASFVLLLILLNAYVLRAGPREQGVPDPTQEIYRLASEASSDGVFEWNLVRDRAFYSPQFWAMLGYPPGRFPDTMQSFKELLHPDDRERSLVCIDKYIGGETAEYLSVFRMRHQSGRWVWINARGRALYDDAGKPVRIIGSHTDISHIKAYEEKLQKAKEYAENASRAKTDFLAHMSHEIRTPLTAISGIAEIFESMTRGFDARQRQLIRILSSSTSSLKDLVNDILDFSRIESGEISLDEKSFDLKTLFDQVQSIISLKAGEKNLKFSFDYDGVWQQALFGDQARLRQILINLIGNAVKFTDKGGVAVAARKDETPGGAFLVVEIRDTGIGIDPQNLDLIFERFKQADSSVSRRYGGSGLGLPISLRLARLMGGDITVQSAIGQGSVFTLTIPLKIQELEEGEEKILKLDKPQYDSLRSLAFGDKNVLLVEDYEGNIVILSYLLESLQCRYDVARTGLEALNMWKDKRYDLILMDVQMPEMDGFTATAQIRRMEQEKDLPRTPVIGMTAHALVGDREKCIEAGMDAYLPKPIVETDLKAKIVEFLAPEKKAA